MDVFLSSLNSQEQELLNGAWDPSLSYYPTITPDPPFHVPDPVKEIPIKEDPRPKHSLNDRGRPLKYAGQLSLEILNNPRLYKEYRKAKSTEASRLCRERKKEEGIQLELKCKRLEKEVYELTNQLSEALKMIQTLSNK